MGNRRRADYRKAQEILWGDAGLWAYDAFVELNDRYFGGEISCRGIAWGLTPYGSRLGHTAPNGRITLHPALLDPKSDAWGTERAMFGERYARDVLLHEMIHVLLFGRQLAASHNAQPWCDEIVRLAPELGLQPIKAAPVKARRVDGKVVKAPLDGHLSQGELALFPHPLRPRRYYAASNGKMPVPI